MVTYYCFALLAAIFWGAGFIGSRFGLEALSPMWVTFFRFLVALVVTLPIILSMKNKIQLRMEMILGALVCGGILTTMIFLQIKGLQFTSVAKSGFITILYAFFTPILCKFLYGSKLSNFYWLMLSIALVGMGLICELSLGSFNQGDLLTLFCAFFSALHILAIGHFTKGQNMMLFNIMQLFAVCLLSLPMAIYLEGIDVLIQSDFFSNDSAVYGLVFMGIFSTSVAFFMQMKAQEKIPPYQASLIFLMESPFAAIMGFMAFGEVLTTMAICGTIVVTMTVAILPFENGLTRVFSYVNPRTVALRINALLSLK